MPTTQEIQNAVRVLEEAGKHVPSIEDIKPGMSAQEIAVVLKAIREAGGSQLTHDPEPSIDSEHDRRINTILTRNTREHPLTTEEQQMLAAETVKAFRDAGVKITE